MASYTKNLNLLKKDPVADGADTFNIETMLNENWDKIDENVATGAAMQAHITNQKNPHNVTAAQIGAAASVHSHTMGQVEGLNTALSNKADLIGGQVPYSQAPRLTEDRTIYVSPDGDNNNPGTQEAPFKTIQAALNSLPKDLDHYCVKIIVAEGEYDEYVRICGFSGGLHYAITIEGDDSGVIGRETRTVKNILVSNCSSAVQIRGICVIGQQYTESISILSAHVDLEYVTVKNQDVNSYYGIVVGRFFGATTTLNRCVIDGFSCGISIYSASVSCALATNIKNCTVGIGVGNRDDGTAGIFIEGTIKNTFENNTMDIVKNGASQAFLMP